MRVKIQRTEDIEDIIVKQILLDYTKWLESECGVRTHSDTETNKYCLRQKERPGKLIPGLFLVLFTSW
jgi:hypothetical protein